MITWSFNSGSNCRLLVALLTALLGFGVCGCSRSASSGWEANGYLDTVTGYRFYTDKDVFAEKCPLHPGDRFVQVLAYVFPGGKIIIAPRDQPNIYDPQTHNPPVSFRYPTEAELRAWGAVKVTRQEVCN